MVFAEDDILFGVYTNVFVQVPEVDKAFKYFVELSKLLESCCYFLKMFGVYIVEGVIFCFSSAQCIARMGSQTKEGVSSTWNTKIMTLFGDNCLKPFAIH